MSYKDVAFAAVTDGAEAALALSRTRRVVVRAADLLDARGRSGLADELRAAVTADRGRASPGVGTMRSYLVQQQKDTHYLRVPTAVIGGTKGLRCPILFTGDALAVFAPGLTSVDHQVAALRGLLAILEERQTA